MELLALSMVILFSFLQLLSIAGLRRRIRNPNVNVDDPSQQLLSQLRKDRELQEKVDRRQKVEDRRAMELARLQELQTWEDQLLGPEIKEHIRTMWEVCHSQDQFCHVFEFFIFVNS